MRCRRWTGAAHGLACGPARRGRSARDAARETIATATTATATPAAATTPNQPRERRGAGASRAWRSAALDRPPLVVGQHGQELERLPAAPAAQRLDAFEHLVAQGQRLNAQPPAGLVLDPSALPHVGQLVTREAEQPRPRRAPARIEPVRGGQRLGERLRREVGGQVAAMGGPPEEGQYGGLVAVVEDAERLGVSRGVGQQLGVGGVGVAGERHHPGIRASAGFCDAAARDLPTPPGFSAAPERAPARAATRWWPARRPRRESARRSGR